MVQYSDMDGEVKFARNVSPSNFLTAVRKKLIGRVAARACAFQSSLSATGGYSKIGVTVAFSHSVDREGNGHWSVS